MPTTITSPVDITMSNPITIQTINNISLGRLGIVPGGETPKTITIDTSGVRSGTLELLTGGTLAKAGAFTVTADAGETFGLNVGLTDTVEGFQLTGVAASIAGTPIADLNNIVSTGTQSIKIGISGTVTSSFDPNSTVELEITANYK